MSIIDQSQLGHADIWWWTISRYHSNNASSSSNSFSIVSNKHSLLSLTRSNHYYT